MKQDNSPKDKLPQGALEQLAIQYTAPLQRFFRRKSGNAADVDDLVQEVFVRMARLESFEEIDNPRAYLFQIASNILKDRARRALSHDADRHEEYDDLYHGYEDISPERVLVGKQNLELFKKELSKLPKKTQYVFVLHRYEGLKYREIGATLNMSVSAVEKHMMTALAKLSGRTRQS